MKKYNDAINMILQVLGEQTIDNGQSTEGIYEAEQAELLLEITKKEILSEGWTFNTDENWAIAPEITEGETSGYIVVAENVLRLDPSSVASNYVRKDSKVYDKVNQTYLFSTPVYFDVVWDVDFDDIPPIIQQYITLKTARILYQRLVGNLDMVTILTRDEQEAMIRARMHEDEVGDYNIFDDTSVTRMITRTSNPVGLRG
jgi:hypothetical protein